MKEVLKKIVNAFPGIDLSDPTWGLLDGPDYSIEFNIAREGPDSTQSCFMCGAVTEALVAIETVCSVAEGWAAMDVGNGEFIDSSRPTLLPGCKIGGDYRDKAIGNGDKSVDRNTGDLIVRPNTSFQRAPTRAARGSRR